MITQEQIAEIIREETWVEMDSARVHGVKEAAEKILQAIIAAQQPRALDAAYCTCFEFVQSQFGNQCAVCRKPPRQ